MLHKFLALVVTFAAVSVVAVAAEEAETKTLKGMMVCTKCKLGETDACANALVVKEDGKDVTYYIKDNGKGEKYHTCMGEKPVTVTGTVVEKDGKMWLTMAKVKPAKKK